VRYRGEASIRTGFLGIAPYLDGFDHDLCDAAIAAYTAFLHHQGKTELCGESEEGAICLLLSMALTPSP